MKKENVSVKYAARKAGVSVSTIYKLIACGKIRGFRTTEKLVRIVLESLTTYITTAQATPYTPKRRDL